MNKIQSVRYSLVDIMNQSGITGVIVKMSAFYVSSISRHSQSTNSDVQKNSYIGLD